MLPRSPQLVRGLGAAVVALAVDLGALVLARYQGVTAPRTTFVIAYIGALAVVSLLAVTWMGRVPSAAHAAMYGAAAGYLSLGVLALPSVGLGLIAAGLLQLSAAGRERLRARASVGAMVVALALLVVGFLLTQQYRSGG